MKSHYEVMNNVSGLYIFPQFMSINHCHIMLKESFNIHDKLVQALVVNNQEEEIKVSQPDMVLRDNHDFLKSKNFHRLCIHDHDGQRLNNEYFPHYGEDGHVFLTLYQIRIYLFL